MWKKLKKNTEFKYALICILFSAIFLLWLIPAYTPSSTIAGDISSAALPNAMMLIILLCGIVMLVRCLLAEAVRGSTAAAAGGGGTEAARDSKAEAAVGEYADEAANGRPARLLLVLVCVLAYLLALNGIGFYLTTILVLPLAVRFYNRSLGWGKILLSSAVLLLFIYVLFEMGLSVKMPRGIFF